MWLIRRVQHRRVERWGREDVLRAAGPSGEWMKEPDDVVPMALFMAVQPINGPTGQSFSLARREL